MKTNLKPSRIKFILTSIIVILLTIEWTNNKTTYTAILTLIIELFLYEDKFDQLTVKLQAKYNNLLLMIRLSIITPVLVAINVYYNKHLKIKLHHIVKFSIALTLSLMFMIYQVVSTNSHLTKEQHDKKDDTKELLLPEEIPDDEEELFVEEPIPERIPVDFTKANIKYQLYTSKNNDVRSLDESFDILNQITYTTDMLDTFNILELSTISLVFYEVTKRHTHDFSDEQYLYLLDTVQYSSRLLLRDDPSNQKNHLQYLFNSSLLRIDLLTNSKMKSTLSPPEIRDQHDNIYILMTELLQAESNSTSKLKISKRSLEIYHSLRELSISDDNLMLNSRYYINTFYIYIDLLESDSTYINPNYLELYLINVEYLLNNQVFNIKELIKILQVVETYNTLTSYDTSCITLLCKQQLNKKEMLHK